LHNGASLYPPLVFVRGRKIMVVVAQRIKLLKCLKLKCIEIMFLLTYN